MSSTSLYPLRFEPILRRLIWGGRRLGNVLGKAIGDGNDYAESWEISDYRDWVSRVSHGPLAGMSLRLLVRERGEELLGARLAGSGTFPLLVKFIDAREVLSVQVHPNDEQGARISGDRGKTEAWVVLDALPGSKIYAGLKPGVGRLELESAARNGSLAPLLHAFEPRQGDCILIQAGTVHAIGAGVLLAEIQQTSDATYRIDDWGRTGPDGKPRELHLAQAFEVIDFDRGPVNPLIPERTEHAWGSSEWLARSDYFAFERLTVRGAFVLPCPDPVSFTILMGLGGTALVGFQGECFELALGQTVLVPASTAPVEITPRGECVLLSCVAP